MTTRAELALKGRFGSGGSEREKYAHDLSRCLNRVLDLQEKKYDRKDPGYRLALKRAFRLAERRGITQEELRDLHARTGGVLGTIQDDSLWRRIAPPEMLVKEVMES